MRSVKTTVYDQNKNIQWYFHIFEVQKISKSGQTIQGIVQSLSLSMKWNRRFRGLTMYVFNFGVGSLEESVKLSRLVILDFLNNSLLWTPFFPNRQPKSSAFYSIFVVGAVFQLLYCCFGGKIKPTWNAGHCFARKFSAYLNAATSKARIWFAICESLWFLTNQNVWFVTSLHCTNPLLNWIT